MAPVQRCNERWAEERRVGVLVDGDAEVPGAVARVLDDPSYREAVRRYAHRGVFDASERIVGLVEGTRPRAPLGFVTRADEDPHPPSPDPSWSESFSLHALDRSGTFGVFSRIRQNPHRNEADGALGIWFPDGSTGFVRVKGSSLTSGAGLCLGALAHERDGQTHRLTFAGEVLRRSVTISIELSSLHPPIELFLSRQSLAPLREALSRPLLNRPARALHAALDLPRRAATALRMGANRRFEQGARATGTITVDGVTSRIEGGGAYDHAIGVGDSSAFDAHLGMSGVLDDDLAFSVKTFDMLGARFVGGYVRDRGRLLAVAEATIANEPRARRMAIDLVDSDGARRRFDADLVTTIPVPIGEGVLTQGRARFRSGARAGYGICELSGQVER
jgi:hypothetical protein